MNMKKLIQRMTDIENNTDTKILKESAIAECGDTPMQSPMQQGTPVSINVSLNASGKEHVSDLLNMMKNAGLGDATPVSPSMMPMRQDMDRLRSMVDEPEMESDMIYSDAIGDEQETEEGYANEPDEDYSDLSASIPNGDDLHSKKRAYAKAQDGDNAMAVEAIKNHLYAALSEKKAKPDFLDVDKDGNKKEPMKKAIADTKKKKK